MKLPTDSLIAGGKLTRYLLVSQAMETNQRIWPRLVIPCGTPTTCSRIYACRFFRWMHNCWNPTSLANTMKYAAHSPGQTVGPWLHARFGSLNTCRASRSSLH